MSFSGPRLSSRSWNAALAQSARLAPRPQSGVDLASLFADRDGFTAPRSLVVDFLYDDYFRRLENDRSLDAEAFCDQFPDLKESLLWAIRTHGAVEQLAEQRELSQTPEWPMPGSVIRGFLLERILGEGSFARVYLARDATLGDRRVVVKLSRGGFTEAQTLGPLNHPNVTPVHSVQQDDATGLTVACMPYLGQATLADVLDLAFADGRRPVRANVILQAAQDSDQPELAAAADEVFRRGRYVDGVVALAADVADALAFVHARGICHRDLKPTNVLVTPAGRAVLLDFNLSATGAVPSRRLAGTICYMAPEQLAFFDAPRGAAAPGPEATADIYAMGVILYELLTGRHPFAPIDLSLGSEALGRQTHERQKRGYTRLTWRDHGVESWLARVVDRCLAYEKSRRFRTAADLAAALRRGPSWRCRWRRRLLSRVGLSTAAIGCALALASGGTVAWRTMPTPPERQLALGREALERGEYNQAVDRLSQVLGAEPGQAQALFLRGRAYQKIGRLDEAIQDFRDANRIQPDGRTKACLGYCWSLRKNYREAAALFQGALDSGFVSSGLYNDLGVAQVHLGQFKEAAANLTWAVRLDPSLQVGYYNRGNLALTVRGRTFVSVQQGIADIEKALQLGPPSAQLYFDAARLRGLLLGHDARHDHAVMQYVERAIQLGLDPSRVKNARSLSGFAADPHFQALAAASPIPIQTAPVPSVVDPLQGNLN